MPLTQSSKGVPVVPVYIDGVAAPVNDALLFNVRSSARGEDTEYLAQGVDVETARRACDSSYRAFLAWKQSTPVERRELLFRVADNLEQRVDELVKYQLEETSCQESWARFNVRLACDAVREIAASVSGACTGELPTTNANAIALVYKEPIGPVLAICPWNACVVLSARALAAPLGAGCTVVFKASELAPRTHHAVVEAFVDAGLPAGCLNQVQARREEAAAVVDAIVAHKGIRKVEFIGSATVGKIIGQLSSKYLKPVLMELGGKAPVIVLKGADLPRAAKLCAIGAFLHHGQICMSTERIIVEREVADEFSEHLKKEVETHHASGAGNACTTGFASHAHLLLKEALENGASLVAGSNEYLDDKGSSLRPTVIKDVTPKHKIYDEETFGPSASLFVVENESEAVRLANDTVYGLNAAVHSEDVFAALRVARQLEFGQVHVGTLTEYDEGKLSKIYHIRARRMSRPHFLMINFTSLTNSR